MDYEKKYKGALGWMQSLYNGLHGATKEDAEHFFPELKESEDERIRKSLLDYLHTLPNHFSHDGSLVIDWIAWLEKQGKQEQGSEFKADDWYVSKVDGKIHNIYYSDKIEPKFHEGEWIVWQDKCYKVNYNGCGYELVDQDGLSTSLEYGTIDENAHIWDITKDAKDGDVLACNDNPFLFLKYEKDEYGLVCCSYCGISNSEYDEFAVNTNTKKYWCDIEFVNPATKEERDLLFLKMHEAGYEWDAEKKELKKIDNEEVNGEDYGIDGLWHAQRILEKTLGEVDGYQTDDGILDHKAAITAVKKLYEQEPTDNDIKELLHTEYEKGKADAIAEMQKPAWSEEDESYLNTTIAYLKDAKGFKKSAENCINWLKSLKDRVQPRRRHTIFDEII